MILLARRDAAGCDDQVVLGAGHGKSVDQRRLAVRTNAKIADGTTKPREECCKHKAVGVINGALG